MARGEIQIIGATTLEEYRKHIEKVAALARRFQPVMVEEAGVEQTIEILKGLRPYYEKHHQVTITDEALEAAARLSERYVNDRFLPDKAIDLMDEAAAGLKIGRYDTAENQAEKNRELPKVRQELEQALIRGNLEAARDCRICPAEAERCRCLRKRRLRIRFPNGRRFRYSGWRRLNPSGYGGWNRPFING